MQKEGGGGNYFKKRGRGVPWTEEKGFCIPLLGINIRQTQRPQGGRPGYCWKGKKGEE